ncbi:acyl-coenzyme A diphosphatase FITM2-like isoform X4 [Penaeus chinensis]|nr:acyl-coenzyme A diphosphatase FITM2-like isoform X4 [Penaeus chinensis]
MKRLKVGDDLSRQYFLANQDTVQPSSGRLWMGIKCVTVVMHFKKLVFVKLGWAWTFSIFGIFNLLSLLIHNDWIKRMKCFAVRLALTTFFFYIWCTITFSSIERYTGYCVHKGISMNFTKRECVKRPEHEYVSFDISGHSFLLVYCIMIIMEESKEILYFLQLSRHYRGAPPLEGKETRLQGRR